MKQTPLRITVDCLATLVIMASCQKNEALPTAQALQRPSQISTRVTLSDAYNHAAATIGTKATDGIDITPILDGGDTVMYLVNYDKGWEVLSGDRRAPEVLMMCFAGKMTPESLKFNEPQSEWLDKASEGIRYLLDNPDYATDGEEGIQTATELPWTLVNSSYKTLSDSVYQDHLLVTKWGQDSPWNSKMPYNSPEKTTHCVAGCGPVAWGQLLYYYNRRTGIPKNSYAASTCSAYLPLKSSSLTLTSSNVTFNANYATWGQMSKDSSSGTETGNGYVSTLLLRLGYILNSTYRYTSTSTTFSSSTIQKIVNEYSLGCNYGDYNTETIIKQITGKAPVIALISCDEGGHAIVIDGYRRRERNFVKTYVRGNDNGQTEIKYETTAANEDYFAINWGWDGNGDSEEGSTIWYNADSDWTPTSSHTFDEKNKMFYGFLYRAK